MWMVRKDRAEKVRAIDFAAVRDEGLAHVDDIAGNETLGGLSRTEIRTYLTENIAFRVDEEMREGLKLYFEFAEKHQLIDEAKPLQFTLP